MSDLDNFKKDCFEKWEGHKFIDFIKNNLDLYPSNIKLNVIYSLFLNNYKIFEKEKNIFRVLFFKVDFRILTKEEDFEKWDKKKNLWIKKYFDLY